MLFLIETPAFRKLERNTEQTDPQKLRIDFNTNAL